jgi:hypothetical protein
MYLLKKTVFLRPLCENMMKDFSLTFFEKTGKKIQDLPYSYILPARSNTYAAPDTINRNKFKIIQQGQVREEDLEAFEMLYYQGKWGILDEAGKELIPCQYAYIDFFRNPQYFKVATGTLTTDVEENSHHICCVGGKWGVINVENQIIVPLLYEWVEEIHETLWAVNIGGKVFYNDDYQEDYWTVRGGKWGVVNTKGKLIVPVQYDVYMKNWFRVKDFIFVQNDNDTPYLDDTKPFDVYDFEGNQILNNKPNPKNHIFYAH